MTKTDIASKPELTLLWGIYTMKQTSSKLRAHVVHVHILNKFASCLLYRVNTLLAALYVTPPSVCRMRGFLAAILIAA